LALPTAKPAKWFQETESGGRLRAWQTYYPVAPNPRSSQQVAYWRGTAQGGFQETYRPDEKAADIYRMTEAKDAAWFDARAVQYDSFERPRFPSELSDERYVEWSTRKNSATLACAEPGCVANASFMVFDYAAERHHHCTLSFSVHVTDFDDAHGREYVELLTVNGREVNLRCHPQVAGCGTNGRRALHACLVDYPLDGLIGADGMLRITGKLSPMVDECPFDGNLLSGQVEATCRVRPPWQRAPITSPLLRRGTGSDPGVKRAAKLQCQEPGCAASATLLLEQEAILNRTCHLTMSLLQTDFDGDLGSLEEVEWVKVEGVVAKEHDSPGGNPCKANVSEREPYLLIHKQDVTQAVQDGVLEVSAKISGLVDECQSDGFLLDADIVVECK